MDANDNTKTRTDYSKILDVPLPPKARRIAVSMLDAKNRKELIEDAGVGYDYAHMAIQKEAVTGLTANQLMQKREILDGLIKELDNILDKDPETPLKYSDKLKAIELKAKLTGITEEKQGDTYNVGVFDLREATEEELVKELARIENMKRNVIDAEVIDVPNTRDV